MEAVKIYKKIDILDPVLIAGWPGMGNVALGVVDYLRRKLGATKFAEIKIDPMTTLDSIMVDNGLARLPPAARNTFYYTKNPDLIVFEGEVQLPGKNGIDLLNKVLDVASEFKASRIYSGAAFPLPISYRENTDVYAAVNKKTMLQTLAKFGISPMEGGHISGMNGLVLGFAGKRNIEAACLLATIPQYAISLPGPKASKAIIEALQHILNFELDFQELDNFIKDMDDKLSIIEDRAKDVLTIEKKEAGLPSAKKIPEYIVEKVERLFREARLDKAKAVALKKELDRWDLYKSYEDRFLDLFKKNQ